MSKDLADSSPLCAVGPQDEKNGHGVAPHPRILTSFPNCLTHVKVWVPEATTQYAIGQDGVFQMRVPVVHRESQMLVWLDAPMIDCSETTVFRDCPEFEPYRPVVPDCSWISRVKQGSTHTLRGVLLSAADD